MEKYSWKNDKAANKWPYQIYDILIDKTLEPIMFTQKQRLEFICPIHGKVSRRICDLYIDINNGIEPVCPRCSREAVSEKVAKTNLERYGVKAPAQNKNVFEKMKQTNLERYGVETVGENPDFQDKIKETNKERYGVEYAILNPSVKEKANAVMTEKYGSKHALQNSEIMSKFKDTMNERYGVDYTLQNEELNNKMRDTMVYTYGHQHALWCDDIKSKMQDTVKERYGVDHISETYDAYAAIQVAKGKKPVPRETFDIVRNRESFINHIDSLNNGNPVTLKELSDSIGFALSTTGQYILKYDLQDKIAYLCGTSYGELEIIDFLNKAKIRSIHRYSKLGPELDIFLPEYNIGIEFNGLYWHSDIYKDKKYHLTKTEYYKDHNIKVIHIYEDEWADERTRDILQSIILSACNVSVNNSVEYARKLKVVELDHSPQTLNKIRSFYNENHLQGYRDASVHIALVDAASNIIECMSFGYPYYGNKGGPTYQYELIRHCTKMYHVVVGGKERIFTYFVNNYPYDETFLNYIVSYCDIDKFTGKSYIDLGFSFITRSKQVWGVTDNFTRRINRNPNDNDNFKTLTKIYGCGNNIYVFNPPSE